MIATSTRRNGRALSARRAALVTAAAACAGVLPLLWPSLAMALNRCETRDGHVTYTNEACPPNTRLARRIDTTPPLIATDPKTVRPADSAATRDDARGAAVRDGRDSKDPQEAKAPGDGKESREAREDVRSAARATAPERPAAPAEAPRIDSGGRIQPATPLPPANPEQEIQKLDELRLRQERQCADLNRRIQFTRADLATATGADRASIELQLRRLEEDARAICP